LLWCDLLLRLDSVVMNEGRTCQIPRVFCWEQVSLTDAHDDAVPFTARDSATPVPYHTRFDRLLLVIFERCNGHLRRDSSHVPEQPHFPPLLLIRFCRDKRLSGRSSAKPAELGRPSCLVDLGCFPYAPSRHRDKIDVSSRSRLRDFRWWAPLQRGSRITPSPPYIYIFKKIIFPSFGGCRDRLAA
jgi:hypothetical protein